MPSLPSQTQSLGVGGSFGSLELSQPNAEAPPIGFEERDLFVKDCVGNFPSVEGLRSGLGMKAFWVSVEVICAGGLETSPNRAGATSELLGGWIVEGGRDVFSRAGLSTFIPRPRPAR